LDDYYFLLQVDRDGKPPVCKLMDYNREMYLRQAKEKEETKKKVIAFVYKTLALSICFIYLFIFVLFCFAVYLGFA